MFSHIISLICPESMISLNTLSGLAKYHTKKCMQTDFEYDLAIASQCGYYYR